MSWIRILKWILQILFTVLLLYISVKKLDFEELGRIFSRMEKVLILPVVILLFLDIFLNSYRLKRLYRLYGVDAGLFKILLIRFYSLFFTLIFPFLGDVYKIQAFKTAYGASYGKNTVVIVLDKLILTFALVVIVLPFWLTNSVHLNINLNPYLWGVFLILIISLAFLNKPELVSKVFEKLGKHFKFLKKTKFQYVKRSGYFREILISSGVSVFRHFIMGMLHLFIAYAIFQKIDFNVFLFLMVVFLIMMAQIIPLSVGGIGLREFIAVSVFPLIGVSEESAFLIASIISSIIILQGVGGGLTYLFVESAKINK